MTSLADFTELYLSYLPEVRRYVGGRVPKEFVDDIIAQVFLDAWANGDRFNSELGVERAWLFGIAKNHVRRHHRSKERQARALARAFVQAGPESADDASDRVDAELAGPELFGALRALRAVDRDLFLLHAIGGLTYSELADVTGSPIGTVRSRLSRTRSRLRSELQSIDNGLVDDSEN